MSYRKFDDAPLSASNTVLTLEEASKHADLRRAIQSLTNRVLWAGTGGTHGTSMISAIGTGGTAGVKVALPLFISVNGRVGTAAAQDNIYLPKGTQSKSTYVKYLICVGIGTAGTVVAGNEGASSDAAKLPDCPANLVPCGYVEYATGTAGAYIRYGGGTAASYNVLSGNTAGTCGTVNAWQSLVHMPYSQ